MKQTQNQNTPLVTPTALSRLNQVMSTIRSDIQNPQPTNVSLKIVIPLIMVALYSGFLYILSCGSEAKVWDESFNTTAFSPLYGLGGSSTNAFFNAEGYFNFYENSINNRPGYEEFFLGPKNILSEWVNACLIGIFTLVPITFQGWNPDDQFKNTLNVSSSATNLPIYMLGGLWFIQYAKKYYNNYRLKKPENQKNTEQKLQDIQKYFLEASSDRRQDIMTSMNTNNDNDGISFIKKLLEIDSTDTAQNKQSQLNHLTLLMPVTKFLTWYQNFGFTMVAGVAGYTFGTSMGMNTLPSAVSAIVFAACNLIPSLGYSINGIDTIKEVLTQPTPLAGQYAKTQFLLTNGVILTLALLSGGTCGGVNRDGVCIMQGISNSKDTPMLEECRTSIAAWISGVIGNLGALPYNGAQSVLFTRRVFQLYYERHGNEQQQLELNFLKQLQKISDIVESMSIKQYNEVFSENELSEQHEQTKHSV
jgi:hypothetical protein